MDNEFSQEFLNEASRLIGERLDANPELCRAIAEDMGLVKPEPPPRTLKDFSRDEIIALLSVENIKEQGSK